MFCLLHPRDKLTVDPLDLSQWTFLVLSTERLNEVFDQQKSVTLGSLRRRGQPAELGYEAAAPPRPPSTVR